MGDFFGGEGAVVEAGAEDAAGEAFVAGGGAVSGAEEDLAGWGFEESGGGFAVGLAVGFAIAVDGGGAVGLMGDGDVDGAVGGFGFGGGIEEFAAGEVVATGDPVGGFFFPEDDGVEEGAVYALDGERAAALLGEVVELDPGFEGFGLEIFWQGVGLGHGLAIEDEGAVFDTGVAGECEGKAVLSVAEVFVEGPFGEGDGSGGRGAKGGGFAVEELFAGGV